jgi:hypothetical protein
MAQGHEMIERWQGRFGLVESLTLVRDLPCAVPGVTLALVDVLGKRGDLQGIHLLQVYTGGDPNTVIEAQGRVERLSVDVLFPRLVDQPAIDGDAAALLTRLPAANWRALRPLAAMLADSDLSINTLRTPIEAMVKRLSAWNDPRDLMRGRESTPTAAFLRAVPLPPSTASHWQIADQILPNPGAALHAEAWTKVEPIYRFPGLTTGACEVERIYTDGTALFLIDPRHLRLDGQVLDDWARLEVSILLAFAHPETERDWAAWLTLCKAFADDLEPQTVGLPRGELAGALELILPLRAVLAEYAAQMGSIAGMWTQSWWATLLRAALEQATPPDARGAAAHVYAAVLLERLREAMRVPALKLTNVQPLRILAPAPRVAAPRPIRPIKRRWALLVGANRYIDPTYRPLRYCVNDIKALETRLSALGYRVVALHDEAEAHRKPTRDNVRAELATLLENFDLEDLLWVHFSCHGEQVNGESVLITSDVRAPLRHEALTLRGLVRQLKEHHLRRVFMTVDACHVEVEGMRAPTPEFIQNVHETAEGYALLSGTTPQQKAGEYLGLGMGLFTHSLLSALEQATDPDGKGFITVDDVKTYVLHATKEWYFEHHGAYQTPKASVSGLGDMIVADFRKVG